MKRRTSRDMIATAKGLIAMLNPSPKARKRAKRRTAKLERAEAKAEAQAQRDD